VGKIKRFEDIIAWQKARKLSKKIYDITRKEEFSSDYSLKNQIRKATNSIMLNIAEGFAKRSDKGFKNFLYISRGSTAEVLCILYIALDQEYISENEFQKLYDKTSEIGRIITGFITVLKKKDKKVKESQ
jgi:four helix bundle protein